MGYDDELCRAYEHGHGIHAYGGCTHARTFGCMGVWLYKGSFMSLIHIHECHKLEQYGSKEH